MEGERKPLWLMTEEAIAKGEGVYKDYWIAFKSRHPEFYEVEGAPPYSVSHLPLDILPPSKPKVVLKPLVCKRCDRSWIPRNEKLPVQCSKCKSPYWNRVKRE